MKPLLLIINIDDITNGCRFSASSLRVTESRNDPEAEFEHSATNKGSLKCTQP